MGVAPRGILSPLRLPIPPQRLCVLAQIIRESAGFVKKNVGGASGRRSLQTGEIIGEGVDVLFGKTGAERRHLGIGIVRFRVLDLLDDIVP